jgi:hypothetical protein
MVTFDKPYGYDPNGLAGTDFNREIIEPGNREKYPDGALLIRVDDNFWVAAALPLETYRDKPLKEIVEELWPQYVEIATYTPDDGSIERDVYNANARADAAEEKADYLQQMVMEQSAELKRLRRARPDVFESLPSRLKTERSYFVRQYEHLLVAMAHPAEPCTAPELKGVCLVCGLYVSDRVHSRLYLDKHNDGYRPDVEWAGMIPKEDDPDFTIHETVVKDKEE